MADNTTLNPGAAGDAIVTREISHAGDTAKLQGTFVMGISGSEGSYTAGAIGGDATNGLDVDVTRVGGNVTVVQGTASNLNVTAELGATDNAVLDAIAASLALLDNSIAAGNELQVDVVAALPAGTNNIGDVDIASIAAGDNNIGNVDIASIAAGDNNIGNVDVVTMPNVTLAAGTNTNEVVGDVAHDAAAAGNPVQTGGYATNNIEGVTQVAAGDLTRTVHDLNGVQVVRPHTTLEEIVSARTTNTDGNSTSLIAAGGSGVHTYLTTISLYNSSSTDGFIDFRDGTGGSVIFTAALPQTGGSVITFPVPLKFADNTAVAFDVSSAISTVYISVVGFQAQG